MSLDAVAAELAQLWNAFLGVAPGREDSFLELGGSSLLAVRLVGAARKRGLDVRLADLYADTAFWEVAAAVRGRGPGFIRFAGGPAAGLVDSYPLTTLQQGMLYDALTHRDRLYYHVVSSATLRGMTALTPRAVRRAAESLAAQHEVLRSIYDVFGRDGPVQVVLRDPEVSIRYLDLQGMPAREVALRVAAEREAEEKNPLSLTTPPIWRLTVCRTGDSQAEVLLTHWHTMLDGWSVVRLLSDLAVLLGAPGAIARPGPAFRDYVALECAAAGDQRSRDFWAAVLAGNPMPLLPGPAYVPPDAAPLRAEAVIGHLASRLRALGRDRGVPVRTVLLAVHLTVLWRMAGRRTCAVFVADGRLERAGANRSIGLFLNPLPLALPRLPTDWADMLALTFAAERELWPHRRYPWALMREPTAAGPPRLTSCFTYADFSLAGAAGELDESVCTGIPLLVDATPGCFSVEADPAVTSLDPAEVAGWHRSVLEEALHDQPVTW
jgi:hypothetical protein